MGQMKVVGDRVGAASDFKLINQVYCAIQICVTGYVVALSTYSAADDPV